MSPFHVVEVDTFLLTFTPDNWDEPQTVTITTREDDDSIDAWAAVVHTIDADRSSNASSIRVLITDLDQPLAVTGPTSVNYAENDISSAATYSVTTARAGRINWRLLGHDKDDFSISGTGALTFDSPPDHEAPTDSNMDNVYRVTVHASGRSSTGVLLDVAITVADVGGPAAPRLVAASPVQATTDALEVTWSAPPNTDKPAIDDYDLQYREAGTAPWNDWNHTGNHTTAELTGLKKGTAYEVQVAAGSDEGTSPWSTPGDGRTNIVALSGDAAIDYAENSTASVETYTFTDPGITAVSWLAPTGPDAGDFTVTDGVLEFASAPDHEQPTDSEVRVRLLWLRSTGPRMQPLAPRLCSPLL